MVHIALSSALGIFFSVGSWQLAVWIDETRHKSKKYKAAAACAKKTGKPLLVTQIPFLDKSFGAAFASHLVEHLPTTNDAKGALAELNRVAEAVFIVYPSRQSIAAWVKREHHLWVWQKGNVTYLEQRGNSGGKKRGKYP